MSITTHDMDEDGIQENDVELAAEAVEEEEEDVEGGVGDGSEVEMQKEGQTAEGGEGKSEEQEGLREVVAVVVEEDEEVVVDEVPDRVVVEEEEEEEVVVMVEEDHRSFSTVAAPSGSFLGSVSGAGEEVNAISDTASARPLKSHKAKAATTAARRKRKVSTVH